MTLFLVLPWTSYLHFSYNIGNYGHQRNLPQGVGTLYQPRATTPLKKNHFMQSVFFILLVVIAAYVLLQSPLFEVKSIIVSGNRQLKAEEIKKLSGITPGSNIFKINLQQAREKLALVPIIKKVELKRKLPATIVINVTERNAVALLPVKNGFIKVDSDGVYLHKGDIALSALPIITGLSLKVGSPGERVESPYLPLALDTLAKLPRSLVQQLSEIHINESGQIWLYTLDGAQGRLGLGEDIEYKGLVFLQVLNSLSKTGGKIEYVDLSNPKVPVVKYEKNNGRANR
ncbi:Polypeptide-transport-associated domain protein FtsQ-type [Desulfotomaculum nigrificans CO-1-SRB]|uniref:Polypeptide-transport-associated domain protein FtsQ-type n=1 Tax=Desulfotomaculum nigrificans (strain DSM 14880 / VKM B-2319 / CO-1-SRB) TaxID=868595 RepID=F6B3E2_DESCC|nr:Polypeptide-transport-associated domain protein FtsQ-type [Desulfotomaculum nigrificans CO-1-SRB]